jgi:signal transduction histidine kinase
MRMTTVLLVITGVFELLFLVGLLISRGQTNPIVNIWLELATQWLPVSIFWVAAFRTRFARWDVVLAAAAVTFSAVGDTYYSFAMDSNGVLDVPSPADAGYLLFYPLMVGSLIALVKGRLAGGQAVLLESAIACLGAASLLTVILGPVLQNAIAGPDALGSAVSLAYPILDVLLVAAMVGIVVGAGIDVGPRSRSLMLGLGVFAAADVAYALLQESGMYVGGTPLDACWAIGLALMTWWVDGAGRPLVAKPIARKRRFEQVLPAVAVGAGLGVLLLGSQVAVPLVGLILAAITVTLAALPVMFRQAMLSRLLASQGDVVKQLKGIDRAKTDMLVTINHEFRTPLTIINGYLEFLIDGHGGELSEPAVKMLGVVKGSSDRMRGLLADILTMSHLESRAARTSQDLIDIERLVSRVVMSLVPSAEAQCVQLRLGRRWANSMVEGNERQLERALSNLLDNSLKFTPPGGKITVSVENAVLERGSTTAVIRVVDTGIGIPAEDIPQLFDRFFRASNVQSSALPGAGLGLAMSRSIVEAHGGVISAESDLGSGTTVIIQLPAPGQSRLPRVMDSDVLSEDALSP